jgi:hypothetical protein
MACEKQQETLDKVIETLKADVAKLKSEMHASVDSGLFEIEQFLTETIKDIGKNELDVVLRETYSIGTVADTLDAFLKEKKTQSETNDELNKMFQLINEKENTLETSTLQYLGKNMKFLNEKISGLWSNLLKDLSKLGTSSINETGKKNLGPFDLEIFIEAKGGNDEQLGKISQDNIELMHTVEILKGEMERLRTENRNLQNNFGDNSDVITKQKNELDNASAKHKILLDKVRMLETTLSKHTANNAEKHQLNNLPGRSHKCQFCPMGSPTGTTTACAKCDRFLCPKHSLTDCFV